MNGKGSKPRPFSVSHDQYAQRWEQTFGKKDGESSSSSSGSQSEVKTAPR